MASEERKAADNKIIQENLFKTLGAEEVQAETDAFQCSRCKQVSIHQLSIDKFPLTLSFAAEMPIPTGSNSQRG